METLNEMILEIQASNMDIPLQTDIDKEQKVFNKTIEDAIFMQYISDVRDIKEKYLKNIQKFTESLLKKKKLRKKQRRKMLFSLMKQYVELRLSSHAHLVLMQDWDSNRLGEFKQIVNDSFLFDLDPAYAFDYNIMFLILNILIFFKYV